MNIQLRLPDVHYRSLCQLLADMTREQCCFLVCGAAQGDGNETILLVREVLPLLPQELLVHAPDQLSVEPAAMLRMARRAQALGGSLCMVHTHPMCTGSVAFSTADDYGNERTFEFFSRMLPGQPNSCLVFDRSIKCVQGRVYESSTMWKPISQVVLVSGERREVLRSQAGPKAGEAQVEERFDRQARLLGTDGQHRLGQLCLGVIGCGGIGSFAALLGVHSGVKEFALVDFDTVTSSNLSRIPGCNSSDLGLPKVEVVKRYLVTHSPEVIVRTFQAPVESPDLLRTLASLDALICATDDTTSRAFVNQLCHQFYVPVLDLGVQFAADPVSGDLVKEVGRDNLMLPGTTCLSCSGQIDPSRLQAEGLPRQELERRIAEGYVEGFDVPEPSMMVFNAQVAARGMQTLISWATGLHPISRDTLDNFRFLGLHGEPGMKAVRKRSIPSCPICGSESSLVGSGDQVAMFVRPRPRDQRSA